MAGSMAGCEEQLYCVCRRPYLEENEQFMIECDVCKDWFHGSCVGVREDQARDIDCYHCPNCEPHHGPLTLKRKRNCHRHDYYEISDRKAVQSGTLSFINQLKKKSFHNADDILVQCRGDQLTSSYLDTHGFSTPIMVQHCDGLGLQVPSSNFTIAEVEKHVGSMRLIDVIDVARQDDIRMTMREWTDYYEQGHSRKKVLNVISLEFSDTSLSHLVTPPSVVREIDWINVHWPDNVPEDSCYQRPQVQKYCLMGVRNSYTDFHVDFGGTSVWYHVLRGEKVFYLIPPSEENLIKYEHWVMSVHQSEIFFGGQVSSCYKCRVLPGNTLFIPTGWIHAVLTPEDSLVFGGNFLHHFNIGLQLRIYEMELRLLTPHKFLHPSYESLTWYAARNFLTKLEDCELQNELLPDYLLYGMKALVATLSQWTSTKQNMKAHRLEIPHDIIPSKLLPSLSRAIAAFTNDKVHTDLDDKPDRSITLTFSHGQFTRREKDGEKEHITMKLSVQSACTPFSKKQKEDQGVGMELRQAGECRHSSLENWVEKERRGYVQQKKRASGDGNEKLMEPELGEDDEFQDDQYVYSSLVGSEQLDKGDETWRPHGPVYVRNPNTSRPDKRNATKASFRKCLEGTAAKLKDQHEELAGPQIEISDSREGVSSHCRYLLMDTGKVGAGFKRQKTFDVMSSPVSSSTTHGRGSKSHVKPKTAKQRLGKILGIDKSGRFMRK